jgi:hypothetical protein
LRASPAVIALATNFVTTVDKANAAASRAVVVSGTVADMNAAFVVELRYYRHDIVRRHGEHPQTKTYQGLS